MSKGDRSAKDKAMASMLKANGVVRDSCNCPVCHKHVSLKALPVHLMNHMATG